MEPADELRLAIIGLGKIARDRHLGAIAGIPGLRLVATADPRSSLTGVPAFPSLEALLASGTGFDAVALCTPSQIRARLAAGALRAGKHVLLEKPPGATVAEIAPLLELARRKGRSLHASWHSRHAPAVEPARSMLASRRIRAVRIEWMEDVRRWHPGQDWIWEPGGLGVFDPGINALSILTRILPQPVFLTGADLLFPGNRSAPIAADLRFTDAHGLDGSAAFDWRPQGPENWTIRVDTEEGSLTIEGGGRRLLEGERLLLEEPKAEYDAIYRHFAALARSGECDVDLAPLVHVADAFLLGRRMLVEDFA
ncbi:Gfo/Idh/MocA family oxidoreductase [Roseomonas sp. SSH11]|uniref:Gfo/Idh/MocA family oxidoreductase n=1 Tax=Pararoseomonas baculiformis TaxID=2820812 RepID=A0ABS4ACK7_9PROT|nr:Gfo/Idh/MocA family oxidoreductase [Pararoseomonas baculiformis]MBP0444735.1 Gfo/Idh/MocA family oxidoreductase [Pararoseomonas baculiformis]